MKIDNRYLRNAEPEEGVPQFSGSCMGVDLDFGGDSTVFSVWVEDDECWFKQMEASTFWLDELIAKLQETKKHLEQNYEKYEWGYRAYPEEKTE